ncbi:MAG TPA: phage holin family protein [Acidimicrobiales bacterium]|jgi:uncharacterized membrane protein YqjE
MADPYAGASSARPTAPPSETEPLMPEVSLGELFGRMTSDFSTLVRKEMELAKVELKEEAKQAGKAGGAFGAAGLAGFMALLLLSFALAWGLAEIMPEGFAFLIVGAIYAIAAAVLFGKARKQMQQVNPVPEQTVETLKEDAQWLRDQRS